MPDLPRRIWLLSLTAAFCLLGATRPVTAGGSADEKSKNAVVNKVLREVINHGADLFNLKNDYAGCYRVYEGALITVRPFLGHQPEMQKLIDTSFADANKQASVIDRAFTLRKTIDQVRERVGIAPGEGNTLWTRLGGTANVQMIVEEFVSKAGSDPTLNFDRDGKYPIDPKMLKQMVVEMISSASGGPYKYSGRDMKHAHKGLGVTDKEFDRTVSHLRKAMEKHGVQAADVKAMLDIVATTRKDIVETPKTVPMKVEPPKVDPPKVDPPKVNPPKVDPPKVNPPKVDPPKVDPPKIDPPKVNPPKVDPPTKVDPPKTEPKKNVEQIKELPQVEPGRNQRTFRPDPVPQQPILIPGNPTPLLPLPGLPPTPQPR